MIRIGHSHECHGESLMSHDKMCLVATSPGLAELSGELQSWYDSYRKRFSTFKNHWGKIMQLCLLILCTFCSHSSWRAFILGRGSGRSWWWQGVLRKVIMQTAESGHNEQSSTICLMKCLIILRLLRTSILFLFLFITIIITIITLASCRIMHHKTLLCFHTMHHLKALFTRLRT